MDLNRPSIFDDEVDQCHTEHGRRRDSGPRSADTSVALTRRWARRAGATPRSSSFRRRLLSHNGNLGRGGHWLARCAQIRIRHECRSPTRRAHHGIWCSVVVKLLPGRLCEQLEHITDCEVATEGDGKGQMCLDLIAIPTAIALLADIT